MADRELARDNIDGLEAATAFNAPVFQSHADITAVVRQHIGTVAATLFAKPHPIGSEIVWTTDLEGTIRHWNDLSGEERSLLDQERKNLNASLAAVVDRLRRSGINTRSGNLSHLLQTALLVPGVEHLHMVGHRLVLSAWGFHRPGESGLDPLGGTLPVAAPPAIRNRRVLPLLGTGLATLATLLLVAGTWFWPWSHPTAPQGPGLNPLVGAATPPPAAPPVPVIAPEPATPLREAPPAQIAPPQPTAALPPPPKSPPIPQPSSPAPSPKPNEALRVPLGNELSSLQGCWRTEPFAYAQNRPLSSSTYCFDARGRGQLTHTGEGHTCQVPAAIELHPDGGMYLADHDGTCSDGSIWYQDRLLCRNGPDGIARCTGSSSTPGGLDRWTTTLHRP